MTIPMATMAISLMLWLGLASVKEPQMAVTPWLIEVSRIVFAASVLVVLWGKMAERAF